MAKTPPPNGPDLARGVSLTRIPREGALAGRVADQPVLLARRADGLFAVSGLCTHYGASLAGGLIRDGAIHCPWHHACFDLRTGEALDGPAFDSLQRWKVEVNRGRVFVRERLAAATAVSSPAEHPRRIVIVGGGAGGFSAAEKLRRLGYQGELTVLSADTDPPCDRPNLSKDYLAGTAPADWIPLKGPAFYRENEIDLRLDTPVVRLDVAAREAVTESGERFGYDAMLLATGAEPVRPPSLDGPNVYVLRSLADARGLATAAGGARKVVVVGASFIGLEAAASLRARGLEVHVVAPEMVPMEGVLGWELGLLVQEAHVRRGVIFNLDALAESWDGATLRLVGGRAIEADLLVLGVGVRPRLQVAEASGLRIEGEKSSRGVAVDAWLRTSADGVYAAGDIARYPDPRTGEPMRVEHWVHACRQGQTVAANMLGMGRKFTHAPFFWSNHYDLAIRYVGHAAPWHSMVVDGDVGRADATVGYYRAQRLLAAASIGRDLQNLEVEAALENLAREPEFPRTRRETTWRRIIGGNRGAVPASNP